MIISEGGTFQLTEIPGVMGSHPSVDLFLHDPAGAKTTGSPVNVIDGVEVSCVDVAVPMVIIRAADVGKTSYESVAELTADGMFLQRLKSICDLSVRYFTPQTVHASRAVSGGCCLAAATLIPGSVAHGIAPKDAQKDETELRVGIENPAGILGATVVAHTEADEISIRSAAYQRSAQVLLAGYVPLYRASTELQQALASN